MPPELLLETVDLSLELVGEFRQFLVLGPQLGSLKRGKKQQSLHVISRIFLKKYLHTWLSSTAILSSFLSLHLDAATRFLALLRSICETGIEDK